MAGFDCLDSDRDDQMGLTDSGLTDDQPAAALFDESAGGQIKDLLPVDRVVKGEVEVLQVLLFRELAFSVVPVIGVVYALALLCTARGTTG